MAGFFNRLFSKYTNMEEDEGSLEYSDYYDSREGAEAAEPAESISRPQFGRRTQSKVVDFKAGGGSQVIVVKPENMEAAQELCNHLRAGRIVICNFEQVDQKIAQRVVDFITGSAYALDGEVQPVSSLIFVIVPRQVTLMEGLEGYSSTDYLRQAASML